MFDEFKKLLKRMGRIIVISGPSGSGKTTVCWRLLEMFPELAYSVSTTTRKKRDNEKEGIDYYFVDGDKFREMIFNNEFIEWEEVHGDLYGTLYRDIEKKRNEKAGILMDIDPKGGINIKRLYPDSILIFLSVSSIETLIERLSKRRTEDGFDIDKRVERAREEFELSKNYDFIIVNNDIEPTLKKLSNIIKENMFSDERDIKK